MLMQLKIYSSVLDISDGHHGQQLSHVAGGGMADVGVATTWPILILILFEHARFSSMRLRGDSSES